MVKASKKTQDCEGALPVRNVGADLLGVFIFALGLGAVIGAGYWGYVKLMGGFSPVLSEQQANSKGAVLEVREGSDLREHDFQGQWEAVFDDAHSAVLVLDQGKFQMVYFPDGQSRFRRYSMGGYEFDAGRSVLFLRPDPYLKPVDYGAPGIEYSALTHREYKLFVAFDARYPGKLLVKPSVIEGVYDQIHPLFFLVGKSDSYTIWGRR